MIRVNELWEPCFWGSEGAFCGSRKAAKPYRLYGSGLRERKKKKKKLNLIRTRRKRGGKAKKAKARKYGGKRKKEAEKTHSKNGMCWEGASASEDAGRSEGEGSRYGGARKEQDHTSCTAPPRHRRPAEGFKTGFRGFDSPDDSPDASPDDRASPPKANAADLPPDREAPPTPLMPLMVSQNAAKRPKRC